MEEQEFNQSSGIKTSENGRRDEEVEQEEDSVLQFLDSMDSYLTLMDSLSSTLRQGWLQIASARHAMGSSRVTGALLDLKPHSAATTLQVVQHNFESSPLADPMVKQPHFTLSKWTSSNDGKCCVGGVKVDEEELQKKSTSPQLRRRGPSQFSEEEEYPASNGASLAVDDQVQKERSKSLSVFGTLVSPKLRTAQHSFETALETLVEIANRRSLMLSAFVQVQQEMEGSLE